MGEKQKKNSILQSDYNQRIVMLTKENQTFKLRA